MEVLQPGLHIQPEITHKHVVDLADKFYGFKNFHIRELNSYFDKNYHLQAKDGTRKPDDWIHGYVLKIINALDSKKLDFVEAQNEIMLFLGIHGIKCPQPVKNVHGKYYSVEKIYGQTKHGEREKYKTHVVCLLTYLPGVLLSDVPCTEKLFYETGCYIANLDLLLQDFKHPAYDKHKGLWMLENVPSLENLLYAINDPHELTLIQEVIQDFTREVIPKMNYMNRGLIHGDFNENNILMEQSPSTYEWSISGILDFGDSSFSCYVFELAITTCYMMLQSKLLHPVEAGGHVIAGYITKLPLSRTEFHLLKLCICARLCQSLVLGAYTRSQDPENQYLLTTPKSGWILLQELQTIPDHEVYKRWEAVIASYSGSQ